MKKNSLDANGVSYNRSLLMVVLLIGSFCTVLNQTLLSTAFPDLMKEFSVSATTIQWLTTGFLLINGIMIPITAYMMNNIPTKKLYITAMVVFLIGTLQCGFAPNFNLLLLGRCIQAIGVGISLPLLQTIMLTIFPKANRGVAMGISGIVISLAPAIGPTLSGWIIDTYNWRYLFHLIAPIIVIVLIFSYFFMQNVLSQNKSKLDYASPILSTIGFSSLLYSVSSASSLGWDNGIVVSCFFIGIVALFIFSKRQFSLDTPFLNLRVFKDSVFTRATILCGVAQMAMVGAEMVLPMYIQNIKGDNAFNSGLTLLPGALVLCIMMPITGKLFDKYGIKFLATTGMFLLTAATLPYFFITKDTPNIYITVLYGIRMLGISMVTMPVTTYGMNSLPDKLITHGTAVNSTTRQVFSSIGTAILISSLAIATKNSMPIKQLESTNLAQYKIDVLTATLNGYHIAFLLSSIFSLVGLFIALSLAFNQKRLETQS